jgi:hypothetical protein
MIEIVYISDVLLEDHIGGGEINDSVLCDLLSKSGFNVERKRSFEMLEENIDIKKFYIISNFIMLNNKVKSKLQNNCRYIIYEHDHKYLKNRNPAVYDNYKAPKSMIVNEDFYKNAKMIFCQTSFHENIIKKNINLQNIYNVSGNLWSEETLDNLLFLSKKPKKDCYSILDSSISHKNTRETVFYCQKKKYIYELISSKNYNQFLQKLSSNDKLIFLPKTPETLSRIIVEARMMNIKTITNKKVGACYEDWFNLKGEMMINFMKQKKLTIVQKIVEILNG